MTSREVSLPLHLNHLLGYVTMRNAIHLNAQGNDPLGYRLQLVHALGPDRPPATSLHIQISFPEFLERDRAVGSSTNGKSLMRGQATNTRSTRAIFVSFGS